MIMSEYFSDVKDFLSSSIRRNTSAFIGVLIGVNTSIFGSDKILYGEITIKNAGVIIAGAGLVVLTYSTITGLSALIGKIRSAKEEKDKKEKENLDRINEIKKLLACVNDERYLAFLLGFIKDKHIQRTGGLLSFETTKKIEKFEYAPISNMTTLGLLIPEPKSGGNRSRIAPSLMEDCAISASLIENEIKLRDESKTNLFLSDIIRVVQHHKNYHYGTAEETSAFSALQRESR